MGILLALTIRDASPLCSYLDQKMHLKEKEQTWGHKRVLD